MVSSTDGRPSGEPWNCTSRWAAGLPVLASISLKQAGRPLSSFVTFSADHPAGRSSSASACALRLGTAGLVVVGTALVAAGGGLGAAAGGLAAGEAADDDEAAGLEAAGV